MKRCVAGDMRVIYRNQNSGTRIEEPDSRTRLHPALQDYAVASEEE
jgi:hypothetical protein